MITGETLNDFERGMKAAGAAIDLFTLGQAMVLAGGVEAGAGIIVKTLAVEMVSNAAGYSAGYAANEMGMPLPVTWILSVATGCTVSATVGGYLFTSADGTITKCTAEEAGDLIKRLDKTDSPASFADMMSPEDAARYLRFLENGSTEGLTSAELEGIKKVDELLALKKISYQDVLDIRNSGKALEGGSNAANKIGNSDTIVHSYTRDEIINSLNGVTQKSTEIANGIQNGKIKINVLGDELFESYLGCSSNTMAMQVGNQIYVRSSSASLFSDVVHEGVHAMDFINGVDESVISSWSGETSAYSAERLFQLESGMQVQFESEEDMMVHIWSNYKK